MKKLVKKAIKTVWSSAKKGKAPSCMGCPSRSSQK
jgi:hypothetical protein